MKVNFESLISRITGSLILPGDENYDEARKVFNAMIDKKPLAILECSSEADIVAGINFTREKKLEVTIRGGGHHGAGLSISDDAFMIDLSKMKGIHVDSQNKTVNVEAGCTLKEVGDATHEYGLTMPIGVVGSTGISGFTLGGGLGYLNRKAGLTIDSLVGARVVLATGDIVDCNESAYPDLFWALRGGGGNFGVVVNYTYKLFELSNVYAGPLLWSLEEASEVLRFYDNLMQEADNDLYGVFAFMVVPPGDPFPKDLHNKTVCGIIWNYTGPLEKAEEVFKPIRAFGNPVVDMVGELPVPVLNTLFDDLYPKGMQWYWKAHYVNEISDDCIRTNIEYGSQIPSLRSTMHYYPINGKVHDVKQDETAWANRDKRYVQLFVGIDPDPENKEKITHWCRKYYDAMLPYVDKGAYINFMMKEGDDRVKLAYRSNYDRLVEVKRKYDPENFFHVNQNIKP